MGRIFITAKMWFAATSVALADEAGPTMLIQGVANPPIGHYEQCKRSPTECGGPIKPMGPLKLTPEVMKLLKDVNSRANARTTSKTDVELYGVEEYWAYPTGAGDVEDVALLKQRELADKGVPLSNLLLTVAITKEGEGTALLVVITDKGDFILDQLTDEVKLWRDVPYTFLKRQSESDSSRWVKVRDVRDISGKP